MTLSNSSSCGNTLAEVRSQTRAAHVRLENRLLLTRAPTRARYTAYLARMFGVIRAVETLALRSPLVAQLLPDVAERSHKSFDLANDLAELGLSAADLPLLPVGDVREPAQLLGMLYVTEGSTLGGVVLARQLEAALGAVPTRYLRCYGNGVAAKWRAFLPALESVDEPAARTRVARHALALFEAIEGWLEAGDLLGDSTAIGPQTELTHDQ